MQKYTHKRHKDTCMHAYVTNIQKDMHKHSHTEVHSHLYIHANTITYTKTLTHPHNFNHSTHAAEAYT